MQSSYTMPNRGCCQYGKVQTMKIQSLPSVRSVTNHSMKGDHLLKIAVTILTTSPTVDSLIPSTFPCLQRASDHHQPDLE
jgi:hypothetical protein